jgi:2-alkyl-3-oxoalkanoate reductase
VVTAGPDGQSLPGRHGLPDGPGLPGRQGLPPRVAVTGSSGVLGSRLVGRLLEHGCEVHGVDICAAPPAPGLVQHTGDVRDPAVVGGAISAVDAVVHCAAALPSHAAAQIRSVIVDGTATVLAAAAAARVDRAVHISSTAVYGLPRDVPTGEDHPAEPVDPYSAAKAAAEEVAQRHRDAGRCLSVLRPKTFLGPGRMGLFAMLFQWADEGRNFPVLGRGDVRIQMLGLDDLVDAVLTTLTAPASVANDTYNIGAARFGTLREDFQSVLDAAGHGRRVVSIPAQPALGVLRLLERTRLSPVYGRLLSKLQADSYVDISKARRQLGFTPALSNQDAIGLTYRWWRDHQRQGHRQAAGRTSREPWRQGVLGLVRVFF